MSYNQCTNCGMPYPPVGAVLMDDGRIWGVEWTPEHEKMFGHYKNKSFWAGFIFASVPTMCFAVAYVLSGFIAF